MPHRGVLASVPRVGSTCRARPGRGGFGVRTGNADNRPREQLREPGRSLPLPDVFEFPQTAVHFPTQVVGLEDSDSGTTTIGASLRIDDHAWFVLATSDNYYDLKGRHQAGWSRRTNGLRLGAAVRGRMRVDSATDDNARPKEWMGVIGVETSSLFAERAIVSGGLSATEAWDFYASYVMHASRRRITQGVLSIALTSGFSTSPIFSTLDVRVEL